MGIASEFSNYLDKRRHIFARVRGDEFILIFKGIDKITEMEELFEQIDKAFCEKLVSIHGEQTRVSYSMGYSVFPEEAVTVDDLIAVADNRMYISKNSNNSK